MIGTETVPKRRMTFEEAKAILANAHRTRIYAWVDANGQPWIYRLSRGQRCEKAEAHWTPTKGDKKALAEAYFAPDAVELVVKETSEFLETWFERNDACRLRNICKTDESFPFSE